jgi:hypothetical protein
MPSDLESNLVKGGLSPALSKIIANAIANAASPQTATGRRYGDATPTTQLRMVDGDTRRYVLTNLDHAADDQFSRSLARSGGQYSPRDTSHPYQGSQPATAQGTLTTPSVKGDGYVRVETAAKDSVQQANVGLRIVEMGGRHPRLNQTSKAVEAVPFSVEIDQEQFMDARFEERPTGTVLKLTIKNLKKFTLADGSTLWGWIA